MFYKCANWRDENMSCRYFEWEDEENGIVVDYVANEEKKEEKDEWKKKMKVKK